MKWRMGRRSSNVEDQRGGGGSGGLRFPGRGGFRGGRFPGGMGPRMGGRRGLFGGGIGAILLFLLLLVFGGDLSSLLGGGMGMDVPQGMPGGGPVAGVTPVPGGDERAEFVSVVLADTEDTWHAIFNQYGRTYQEPKLVLFDGYTRSACGMAQSATGPFYCPNDQKVYIDLSFYDELRSRFRAPGDFAQAYVIAHEVGHHVQDMLGILDQARAAQARASEADANAIQVRVELQADCLAGVWANHAQRARQILETGDLEEAMNAAAAIGDDRLQRQAQGYVTPDSFTHGSSTQRVRWFRRGFESGDLNQCDTFNAASL